MSADAEPEPELVRVRVPAKINLALRVGPRSEDGYHPLVNVFQAVSLFDDVTAETAPAGEVGLQLVGEQPGVPADEDNLAVRAARLLAAEHGDPGLGVRLTLRKTIPVAGGMAGGSADAAGALLACSVLWDLDVQPDQLTALAARLGADVPFALLGGTAIGTGRGDVLAPVLSRGTFHWVLALSAQGLSTPRVFARFDELSTPAEEPLEVPDALMEALRTGRADALAGVVGNDLQAAALDLRPDLADVLERGRRLGALAALVSGSGPTCAFLCAEESAAIDVSTKLGREPAVHAVRRVHGPVEGARLIS
ncbi:4-(cytidine 5'-diphospho)-2-C-methyl-D-erythritol kinase [Desertihabitans aurantiacus]|uniref:4-(cytidine 5'-diphospho)-2-C-methyl-D-erythritol kinase n=1 Tax=Desertihabitans aurantiacus TaxID=2282477 RepID=UPI000DF72D2F|nr:4-(cytidine 5'-diphospho)-2-C-methyl-D-erythritol kinase [Desertihabitans aurantiacus]